MNTKGWTRLAGGLGAAAVLALGLAVTVPQMQAAQDQTQTQGEHMGPGRGLVGRWRMGGPGGPGGLGFVMRDLSDAQREQVRAIRERHAEQMKPLVERSRTARAALDEALLSGKTDNLQALSIEVGNAETELVYARAQVQAEIFKVLTPEQKQKIAERRKQMEARRNEMAKRRQQRSQQ